MVDDCKITDISVILASRYVLMYVALLFAACEIHISTQFVCITFALPNLKLR